MAVDAAGKENRSEVQEKNSAPVTAIGITMSPKDQVLPEDLEGRRE